MAETTTPEPEIERNTTVAAAVDMVVETEEVPTVDSAINDNTSQKREREDDENDGVSKKQKVDDAEEEQEEEKKPSGPVKLGHKTFNTSVELFDYFNNFLHAWGPNLDVNKYEHTMLLELLMKGHPEPDKKFGAEICAFQVRRHPMWKSKCFFLIRKDESADDFSFRKCVDHILPLPEAMQVKPDANRALGGPGGAKHHRGGGGGGGGGGRGGARRRGGMGKSKH